MRVPPRSPGFLIKAEMSNFLKLAIDSDKSDSEFDDWGYLFGIVDRNHTAVFESSTMIMLEFHEAKS